LLTQPQDILVLRPDDLEAIAALDRAYLFTDTLREHEAFGRLRAPQVLGHADGAQLARVSVPPGAVKSSLSLRLANAVPDGQWADH